MGNACSACDSNSADVPRFSESAGNPPVSQLIHVVPRGQHDQLLALLEQIHLGQFHAALTQDYGITSAEQLKFLDDADMDEMGMKKVHKKAMAELMAADQQPPPEEDKAEKDALSTAEQPTARAVSHQSHQGSATKPQPQSTGKPAEENKGTKCFWGNKHAFLTYQWDCQKQVVEVRDLLQERGIPTWMDIDGGMQTDIYDSMAQGVGNAAVAVPFMTKKYETSENCALELKFARQTGVPIVPVMMQPPPYKAGGWLGLLTAGSLWTPLHDTVSMRANIDGLVRQIHLAASDDAAVLAESDFTVTEMRTELERIRTDTDSAKPATVSEICALPRDVIELPSGISVSSEMHTLLEKVAHPTSTNRIGFCGMGGVGKTTVSSWIVRQTVCRTFYDKILWVPLGQTPDMARCYDMLLNQVSGSRFAPDTPDDKRKDDLINALAGQTVLIVLDDAWERNSIDMLNLIDDTTKSKVLVSSRARDLLLGFTDDVTDIGLPTEQQAASMLLSTAGIKLETPPPEAFEIVRFCDLLPLAIGMAGKFLEEFGLADGGDADWEGILSEIKNEFEQSDQTKSIGERIIATSLKSLKGPESQHIIALFRAMALIPEDQQCPLEVLPLLLQADSVGEKRYSVLRVRKWLKKLLDRSLVLGTINRPSLHDIVRDYVISQHTDAELSDAHKRAVDIFRSCRPGDFYGRKAWVNSEYQHEISLSSVYICETVNYHIDQAFGTDREALQLESSVLFDTPQDELVLAAARLVGLQTLASLAAQRDTATITEDSNGPAGGGGTLDRIEECAALLRKVPLLKSLSAAEQKEIAENAEAVHYADGEQIIEQGEPGDAMYIVQSGLAKVFVIGAPDSVMEYGPGDFFGELALRSNKPRAATVKARGDSTELIKITRTVVERLISQKSEVVELLDQQAQEYHDQNDSSRSGSASWWTIAKLRSLEAAVLGGKSFDAADVIIKCREACSFAKVEHDNGVEPRSDSELVDLADIELDMWALVLLTFRYDYLMPRLDQALALAHSDAGQRDPCNAGIVKIANSIPALMSGDAFGFCSVQHGVAIEAYKISRKCADPLMKARGMTFGLTMFGWFWEAYHTTPECDYRAIPRASILDFVGAFDFELFHPICCQSCNADMITWGAGLWPMLVIFYGDFKSGDWYLKEHSIRYIKHMLENPNWNVGGAEDWGIGAGLPRWAFYATTCRIPDMHAEVASILAETNAAQYVYHHGGIQKEGEDLLPQHMIKAEMLLRMAQLAELLVSTDVTPEAALERLPDVETIVAMVQSSIPMSNHYLYGSSLNGFVYAALVCEKFGLLDKALEYTAACWDPEKYGGGDLFPLVKSLAHSIKGRVCARQGKTTDAIEALEAAAGEAKRGELNVYEAFALYDLKDVRANATLPEDDKLKKRLNDLVKAMVAPSQVLLDAIAT